ncbi:translation factor Sua5 [Thermosipho melanesiensis]|uniref:Threonylcarbamoyl-AMP synthase n=2 Tax=Thermosipho melanesiensis TaxID=46541 RepID=A6LJK4_THEM4|nr:L-threonylcarbamoyladenylate synthase [Thermosipho melanesiensis]ABR30105.1 Sua5/YciO/YrdC/YwlC family protein [Thermosipho melanesiensis BI429]APT73302.1 translation factor Sua5 [Thermosipho melanesiensis]OOC38693.1 translation factor Sua5 [Thermosipho melanesiensis]OOC40497.1 translation factor Sua5 [Thermosipho melanesiensis]OOC40762.1 translation factor Sua5 [Thermosipho melanesiensis]
METKILKIKTLSDIDISYPCKVIKSGGLVAFPTETVYGLGASASNGEAVDKIFKVKGRAKDNPLIVHVAFVDTLYEIGEVNEKYRKVIEQITPGPITFVIRKKASFPKNVTASLNTVGVRIPAHPVARKLCEYAGPIAAPSANLSGKPSPTDASAVIEDLFGKIECIIDAGNTPFGIESTIIDLSGDIPIILRPGPITIEKLHELFGEVIIPDFVKNAKTVETPKAPGMKYRHYAPEKPVYIFERKNRKKIIEIAHKEKGVILCPKEHKRFYPGDMVVVLGSLENPYTIAQNLFRLLRQIDKMDFQIAYVEKLEERGILFSVMNRLKKAGLEVKL